jgi:hypothetical protein
VCSASVDPRALLAKGITGKLTLLDGKTGKPHIVIDIEQLAQLCVKRRTPTLCSLREPSRSLTGG